MSAGASFFPPADAPDVEASIGCYVTDAPGNTPTPVIYELDFDTSVSPPTATYQFLSTVTGLAVTLTATEEASFSPTPCDSRVVATTIKIGGGNAANLAWAQDGVGVDIAAYVTNIGIQALLGGAGVLLGYEIVVEQGSNPAGPLSANRVEFVEPGNNLGTNAIRTLSQGESVRSDSDRGIITTGGMTVTTFGVSRALVKLTIGRV